MEKERGGGWRKKGGGTWRKHKTCTHPLCGGDGDSSCSIGGRTGREAGAKERREEGRERTGDRRAGER
eukprot:1122321-Pleurochrysis_carterae.AAC.1